MKSITELLTELASKKMKSLEEAEVWFSKKCEETIPARFREATIDVQLYGKVEQSLQQGKGVYFWGSAGVGKTHAMWGLWKRFMATQDMALVRNLPRFLARLRTFIGQEGGQEEILEKVEYGGVLLLDDLGAEKTTEWNTEILYDMINYRYEKKLLTFCASNLSLEQLAERSGDRIASRIAEMCEVHKVEGKDRRLQ